LRAVRVDEIDLVHRELQLPRELLDLGLAGGEDPGRHMPSSARIFAARRIFGCSPSGNTMRLGSRRAFSITTPMTSRERDSIASSRRRYAAMSVIGARATPDFIAASATAGATHRSTRWSNGFGIRYSRPNRKLWPP